MRTRKVRREAAAEGKTFDEVLDEHVLSGNPFKFAERNSRNNKKGSAKEKDIEAGVQGTPAGMEVTTETTQKTTMINEVSP